MVCGRFLVNVIITFLRHTFLHKYNYFCHLELEIAVAIPASNFKIQQTKFPGDCNDLYRAYIAGFTLTVVTDFR